MKLIGQTFDYWGLRVYKSGHVYDQESLLQYKWRIEEERIEIKDMITHSVWRDITEYPNCRSYQEIGRVILDYIVERELLLNE